MNTIVEKWVSRFGYKSVIVSEVMDIVRQDSPIEKYLSHLNKHLAYTQLGKMLDKLAANRVSFQVNTLFGPESVSIQRVLSGSKAAYTLNIISADHITYIPYSDEVVSLIGGNIRISIGSMNVTFNVIGEVEVEHIGYPQYARYVFVNPARTAAYYVRPNMLEAFCDHFNLTPSLMSMVARGARRHHHKWCGFRVDKPDVRRHIEDETNITFAL